MNAGIADQRGRSGALATLLLVTALAGFVTNLGRAVAADQVDCAAVSTNAPKQKANRIIYETQGASMELTTATASGRIDHAGVDAA